jgi:hypothetical protein
MLVRKAGGRPETEHTGDQDADEPDIRPENGETVFAGLREIGQPLALALNRAGIPALVYACDPLAAGEPEGADAVELLVPAPLFEAANWFVQGFEAAVYPPFDDEEEDGPDHEKKD